MRGRSSVEVAGTKCPYLEGAGQHLITSHQQLTMRQWEDNTRAGTEMPGGREHWGQHSGHWKVVT